MDTVEEYLVEMGANMCNIDILVNQYRDAGEPVLAVRLRPWNKEDKGTMVLGAGNTLLEALEAAYTKAKRHRWETVNWSARPWAAPVRQTSAW